MSSVPLKSTSVSSYNSYQDERDPESHGHGHSHGSSDRKAHAHKKDECDGYNKARGAANRRNREQTILLRATILCFVFMGIEVAGGILSGSLAILTDAAHLLSDVAGMLIGVISIYLAQQPATESLSFGWHRAEILGALVSMALVWLMTGILVYEAVRRVMKPAPVNGKLMFIVATFGLLVNIAMAYVLGSHGHGHSHGGAHGHGKAQHHGKTKSHCDGPELAADGKGSNEDHGHGHGHGHMHGAPDAHKSEKVHREKSVNVDAALVHVIGDAIQSIGVMIGAAIIWYKPEWTLVDPMCTFLFALIVLWTTFGNAGHMIHILMEGSPHGVETDVLRAKLAGIHGVVSVHCFHCWTLTSGKIALTAHLMTDGSASKVLETAQSLAAEHGVWHTTFQLEGHAEHKELCARNSGHCGPT